MIVALSASTIRSSNWLIFFSTAAVSSLRAARRSFTPFVRPSQRLRNIVVARATSSCEGVSERTSASSAVSTLARAIDLPLLTQPCWRHM
ncbi:hypothetical protein TS85_07680 [Sphingomonas hengshuiensis]|uniref:Uncharacterized protein n=1 Tax=Sphingomonas hengshuiensis TaxID=1609977 RepID=A0A7U4J7I3_9SPHN|nr:hypothetical protein TS85_07680 [Sphingomonas hengshuiensis]